MSYTSITKDIKDLLDVLKIPNEVGLFTPEPAPSIFCVIVPVNDQMSYAEDIPDNVVSSATVELYVKGNYLTTARKIMTAIVEAGLTLGGAEFVEKESETGFYHYAIEVEKTQTWEDVKWQQ